MWLATITFCKYLGPKIPHSDLLSGKLNVGQTLFVLERTYHKTFPQEDGEMQERFCRAMWSHVELKFSFSTWWSSAPHVERWHQAGHGHKAQDPNKPSQPVLLLLKSQRTIPATHLHPGITAHTWPSMHHLTRKLAQLLCFFYICVCISQNHQVGRDKIIESKLCPNTSIKSWHQMPHPIFF